MSTEKKSKIPYIFFGFFAVIFLVNFFYIYVAKKTWSGVVTEDSYQKGRDYNETVKQEAQQKRLGWKVSADFNRKNEGKGTIFISLEDDKGRTIPDATIFVNFKRPAQSEKDFSKTVNYADGTYRADVEFPLQGQWDFAMVAMSKDNKRFEQVERHFIQW